MATDNMEAIRLIRIDSVRNCLTRLLRSEPRTFRTPTSFARLEERAVERFIKLTQAMSKMKIAMAEKMYTYWILLFAPNSATLSECRCILDNGVNVYHTWSPLFTNSSFFMFSIDTACGKIYFSTIAENFDSSPLGSAPFFSTI